MQKNKKILIIDDEELDRETMVTVLKREGYSEISCTETGEKGIEIAKSFKPDIVVIDVVLRNIDGFDVCKQIKAIEGMRAKVIMITGHLDAVDAEKARHSGAAELIMKIPGFKNIGQTINKLMRGYDRRGG